MSWPRALVPTHRQQQTSRIDRILSDALKAFGEFLTIRQFGRPTDSRAARPSVVKPRLSWRRPAFTLLFVFGTGSAATQPPPNAHLHWAFQPPREIRPPAVKNTAWPQTDLDRFILAKLEANRLAPTPPADLRTLIRRMTFDLIGLPPAPQEVQSFIEAAKQNRFQAVAQLIERLLASPHYGERWGRHWLDLARYSDTKGYVYGREERYFVHAPTYRDWVIRALNDDLPYDRFLRLQLAADQLETNGSPHLAALGFLTGGRRFLGVTHDIIDDRIDVITRGALGLTVACARCHDHKYDPIPTQDYYSLYGVFHGGDDQLVPLAQSSDSGLADRQRKLSEKSAERRAEAQARLRSRVGDYLAAQLELKNYPEEEFGQILTTDDIIPYSVRRWRDFLLQYPTSAHSIFAPWHHLMGLQQLTDAQFAQTAAATLAPVLSEPTLNRRVAREFGRPLASLREAATRYGQLFRSIDEEWKVQRADAEKSKTAPLESLAEPAAEELRRFLDDLQGPTAVPDAGIVNTDSAYPTAVSEELWKLQGDVDRRLIELGLPAALILRDRPPEPDPHVLVRGRAAQLGEVVPRQFLGILSGPNRTPFRHGSGRLELAQAIANADNPLTARVIVNRLWQNHFGVGLVKTPSDFGLRAEAPSHPELLDWLARRLVAEGWSLKAIHRLIVASATYQQSSESSLPRPVDRKVEASADIENRLLSRFPLRRLDFEQVRDALLAVNGELNETLGGKPSELLDSQNRRRTIYALVDRQFLPGTFRTFDFANPDLHVSVRHETTVPQQALYYLNGTFVAHSAQGLNQRFVALPPPARVQRLYQTIYQRSATESEVTSGLSFVATAEADPPALLPPTPPSSWLYGTGEYDEGAHCVKSFTPFPHFTGTAWQGEPTLPGGPTGWAQLTAAGGHPGNTRAHACIRRWIAPCDATIGLSGVLKHEPEPGEGVRGIVASSRHGELKKIVVHHSVADLSIPHLLVKAGDTLDFIVEIAGSLSYNQFLWTPVLASENYQWDAGKEFAGPYLPPPLLNAWEQYVQVLLLANEFAFID